MSLHVPAPIGPGVPAGIRQAWQSTGYKTYVYWNVLNPLRMAYNYGPCAMCRFFCRAANLLDRRVEPKYW